MRGKEREPGWSLAHPEGKLHAHGPHAATAERVLMPQPYNAPGILFPRLMNTLVSGVDRALGRTRAEAYPLCIHLEVNDFCNLKCPYCPRENPAIPKNTGNLPMEIIERLRPWMRFANFVGLAGNGEPFLHPQIMQIFRAVAECGATPSALTNGTRLRQEFIEELPTLGPSILMVSVDGGVKETFERWRRGADFDQVRESLFALRRERERRKTPFPIVNFITCLMKENLGETEQIVDLAARAGAAVVVFQTLFPYVRDYDWLRIKDLREADEAVERARRRAAPLGIRVEYHPMSYDLEFREGASGENRVGTLERLEALREAGVNPNEAQGEDFRVVSRARNEPDNGAGPYYTCSHLWTQMHVTLTGDVRFCCFWTGRVAGNILAEPPGAIWNSPRWRRVREALTRGEKPECCQGCHMLQRHNAPDLWRSTYSHLRDLTGR